MCNDVAGTENQVAEQVPSIMDSQHEGNHQKYKKEGADIGNQMHGNPVITYECPDFFDFWN